AGGESDTEFACNSGCSLIALLIDHEIRVVSPRQSHKVRVGLTTPDESVQHVVSDLRYGQQWHEQLIEVSDIPGIPEQPTAFVPETAVPEQFFKICRNPDDSQKLRKSQQDRLTLL
ncbi:MAG: hypothetical protein ACK58T_09595, partial [Phycisphaerae bacterium]